MTKIKFKNKRTGKECWISSKYYNNLMEKMAKNIVNYKTNFPLKTESGEFNNIDKLFDFLNKFRFDGFQVRDHRNQSFDGVIYNTLISENQKYALFPYMYNEFEMDSGMIMKKSDFDILYKEIIKSFKENKKDQLLLEWEQFYSDLLENDTVYLYVESNIFNVEIEDIKVSNFIKQENFFEKLKETLNDCSDFRLGDVYKVLEEKMIYGENLLTDEEENEIIEGKMEVLNPEILDKYYLEDNYNALSILNSLKK